MGVGGKMPAEETRVSTHSPFFLVGEWVCPVAVTYNGRSYTDLHKP